MPKIHNVEQCTLEWVKLHMGKASASSFDKILTPEFKSRAGTEMFNSYVASKVAELWRGEPLPQFGAWQLDQGLLREETAIPWYEFEYECKITPVGFIESEDGRCGCSPDGVISDSKGIEFKCPEAHTHAKYLIDGKLPKDYVTQVHGSLFVTGFDEWVFCSFRRKFPAFVITVKRDEEICKKISVAVNEFHEALNAGMAKLKSYKP